MRINNKLRSSLQMLRAKNGLWTARWLPDGQKGLWLHSIYDPLEEAKSMISGIPKEEKAVYVVYGFGLGYHVRELLQKLPVNAVICVIEPDNDIFFSELVKDVYSDCGWCADVRLSSVTASSLSVLAAEIVRLMILHNTRKMINVFHYPTMAIFETVYKNVQENIDIEIDKQIAMALSFMDNARTELFVNSWKNFPQILQGLGIANIKGALSRTPAIIVASGPSLEKNIHQLKECANRAVIIAAGSALGALKRSDVNISPHFLVVLDPYEIMVRELAPHVDERMTLVAAYAVHNDLLKCHKGKKLFFTSFNQDQAVSMVLSGWNDKYITGDNMLRSSVSVATAAFFFALHMECEPIIFVGQDLAMSEEYTEYYKKNKAAATAVGKSFAGVDIAPDAKGHHVSGAGAMGWADETRYVEVDSQDGKKLLSTKGFSLVIGLFNELFASVRSLGYRVVNATEGGALLQEAETMTFKKAKRKYLSKTYKIREKIALVFKRTKTQKNDYQALSKDVKKLREWVNTTSAFWRKEQEEAEKQSLNKKHYDVSIATLMDSEYYVFIKSYLIAPIWRYLTLSEAEVATEQKKIYLVLLAEILVVLTLLDSLLEELLGVISGNE